MKKVNLNLGMYTQRLSNKVEELTEIFQYADDVKLYDISKSFNGHGHYRINLELIINGTSKTFSTVIDTMTVIDDWSDEDGNVTTETIMYVIGKFEDPDCGIDIKAQPPGKKNQSISLLSGGEKALTALSLIFSIFLIKPSPFCLLDEVDAPLDDANVGRFNELLREMSSESQFILITHNKKTMELNDRLYGITMQEPGVSTAVSVQLQ